MKSKIKILVVIATVLAILFSVGYIAVTATESTEVPEGYTPIYTATEFYNIRNDLAGKYVLMDNIDLSSYHSWEPIGTSETPFTGELDGNGKSVLNMTIYGKYEDGDKLYFAMFTAMKNSVIKNLNIINTNIDVEFTGTVSDAFRAGALAGYANTVTIENCIVSGIINLQGFTEGCAGGFFGKENASSLKQCANYINIKIDSENIYEICVGGIAGAASNDTMSECGNYGDFSVECNDSDNDARELKVGGISGDSSNRGIISDCFNRGNFDIGFCMPSIYIGGISGEAVTIENCYNSGDIAIPEKFAGYAGGIAGNFLNGGLAILPAPNLENIYYINEGLYPAYVYWLVPEDADFNNAKLLTEEEFKKQESFAGFDFDSVWEMEENGYPVLQSQPEIPQDAILSGECGDDVNYTFNMVTGELRIFGSGDMDNYDSASMFEGFDFAPWYRENIFVKIVVIEDGVTSIGACAFDGCENMTSIDIPSSVKKIGWAAFICCDSLESLVIPDGTETIDEQAFYGCIGLKTVSIPKSVTSMQKDSFDYCNSLEAITVDSENPNYSSDEYGVLFDKNKTVLIRYPSGNERTSYIVPESVFEIYHYSFASSENLKNIVFSDGLKKIGAEAFSFCTGLTELNLPNSLKLINSYSFYYCTSLKSVVVPEGVKTIGPGAFFHCEVLETISLPDSLERIDMYPFEDTAFYVNEENWDNGVLYCDKYLLAVNEDFAGKLEIKPGTRMIADFAVKRCKGITEVTMPDSLKIIGEGAFNMCSGLKSVKIPASVTTLIGSTFRFCDSLVSVTIPETVTTMGNQVFYECENLESVEINAKISTIGRSMFSHCPKLISVKLPDTVKTIDEAAFRECDSLETIVLPEGLEVIANQGFAWSPKLTNVNLPESLTSIGRNAFRGTKLETVHIPQNVNFIDEFAFSGITTLKSITVDENSDYFASIDGKVLVSKDITRILSYLAKGEGTEFIIPNTVTKIDEDTFSYSENLERITVPDSVTEFGSYMFRNSKKLKSVALGTGITRLGTYFMEGCESLEKLYLSDSVEEISYQALNGCTNLKDIYYGGTEEDWSEIKKMNGNSPLNTATIHFNHVHTHTYSGYTQATEDQNGYKLYSCICGHYYAEYDKVSKSDKYDVTAVYSPDCFNEEITLDVEAVTGDREPGGIYMVDGKTYIQVGIYNLKAVNENGEVIQPNEGHTVKIKMAIPDEYKDKTDIVIYHRFVDGGREKLSTADDTLIIENGYMIFEVSKFSEFEILAGTADMTISKLPDKLNYSYKGTLDLSGIELKITDIDGSVEYVTDTSKMTVEGFDSSELGVQTVTVKYEQYSCTFEVTVSYAWWQWIIRILLLGFLWY